jgi:DNA replication protein DnaC
LLNEHTLTQLRALRLDGMIHALQEAAWTSSSAALNFAERFGMLVQHEIDWRDGKRVARLLKAARLKDSSACIEDIDWRSSRGLDRGLISELATCDWLRRGHNVLVTGATGVGKTWIACALAQRAARGGFSVLYARCSRLLEELRIAHGDGSFARRLAQLARIDLLVLDDLALKPLVPGEQNDLLELLDDRVGVRSTLITSQLEVKLWHTWLADPTVADAILDRLVHSAHRIALKGESLRRKPRKAGESA